MGLFKKKEPAKVYLPTSVSADKEVEEAKLRALEASLEFLNNPKKETATPEKNTMENDQNGQSDSAEDTAAQTETQRTPEAPQGPAMKANPVAPAIQPSDRILHPENAPAGEEKKPEEAPVPKVPETEVQENKPEIVSASSKMWGRRMDYRTAVVKPGAPSGAPSQPAAKPLAPTSVSNVPPAPHMPGNLSSKAPVPPAKTIVPTVPAVPEKANKPTVATTRMPIPATIANAATLVAAANNNADIPASPVKAEAPVVPPKPEMPKPAVTPDEEAPVVETPVPENQVPETTKENVTEKEEKKEVSRPKMPEMIKNPLPTPKKHVAKDMDFDLQPVSSQMHFDIVDMSGIDYFDIN